MAEFWVGVRGDLTAEQIDALRSAGVAVDDLRRLSVGRDDEWTTARTFVCAEAEDEAGARAEVAGALGLNADDLLTLSAEIWR
jgi:hypothetical protein